MQWKSALRKLCCEIITIFLSVSVGATAVYDRFLPLDAIKVIALEVFAFSFATAGGLLSAS